MALLLLAQQGCTAEVRDHLGVGHGLRQLLVKSYIGGIDRRPNFLLFVVCGALIVGGMVVLAWS